MYAIKIIQKNDKLLYLLKIYPVKYDDYFTLIFDEIKKERRDKVILIEDLSVIPMNLSLQFYRQIITKNPIEHLEKCKIFFFKAKSIL